MKKIFNDEIEKFIAENVKGRMTIELTKLINERFGTYFTEKQIDTYKHNHRLHNELPSSSRKERTKYKLFPYEIQQFVIENAEGLYNAELVKLVNERFPTQYTKSQMKGLKRRLKLDSGLTGRFEKGHIPANKGVKGKCAPGCEKTWFKKGNVSPLYRPVGSERIEKKDGYTLIKVADPNIWKLKHRVLWEEHNGPIPKGYKVVFLDGNNRNITIENLGLISRKGHLIMNKRHLYTENPELTKTGIAVAQLIEIVQSKRKMK